MKNKITVAIPAYNNEKHIGEAIESALMQEYPLKEILILDDHSSDNTVGKACSYHGVQVMSNEHNLGIGKNLQKLMDICETKFIIYLCADDRFTHPKLLSDIVQIFDSNPDIGIVGRYCYYFMDGKEGAIGVCRDPNILTSSCCPSGIAFRRRDNIIGSNKIFVEMPSIVAQYLHWYKWCMIKWDTVACRYSPGINTGTKPSYYKESPTQNWIDLLGCNYQDFPVFITLKNRASFKMLLEEIWLHVRNDKKVLLKYQFWFNAVMALLIPGFLLRKITKWYRSLQTAQIIERPNENNLN